MKRFTITNKNSGLELGTYIAQTSNDAYKAMIQDADYAMENKEMTKNQAIKCILDEINEIAEYRKEKQSLGEIKCWEDDFLKLEHHDDVIKITRFNDISAYSRTKAGGNVYNFYKKNIAKQYVTEFVELCIELGLPLVYGDTYYYKF